MYVYVPPRGRYVEGKSGESGRPVWQAGSLRFPGSPGDIETSGLFDGVLVRSSKL